jgi:hypothetical protein
VAPREAVEILTLLVIPALARKTLLVLSAGYWFRKIRVVVQAQRSFRFSYLFGQL